MLGGHFWSQARKRQTSGLFRSALPDCSGQISLARLLWPSPGCRPASGLRQQRRYRTRKRHERPELASLTLPATAVQVFNQVLIHPCQPEAKLVARGCATPQISKLLPPVLRGGKVWTPHPDTCWRGEPYPFQEPLQAFQAGRFEQAIRTNPSARTGGFLLPMSSGRTGVPEPSGVPCGP